MVHHCFSSSRFTSPDISPDIFKQYGLKPPIKLLNPIFSKSGWYDKNQAVNLKQKHDLLRALCGHYSRSTSLAHRTIVMLVRAEIWTWTHKSNRDAACVSLTHWNQVELHSVLSVTVFSTSLLWNHSREEEQSQRQMCCCCVELLFIVREVLGASSDQRVSRIDNASTNLEAPWNNWLWVFVLSLYMLHVADCLHFN